MESILTRRWSARSWPSLSTRESDAPQNWARPCGTPGHLPSWWTSGGLRAAALKANHAWLTAFRGTGAKGARPLCGEVDRNDDVFNATGWLLQSHRLAEIQTALAAVPPGEPTVELAYDDEGLLRLLPKAGGSYAGGRGGDEMRAISRREDT